MAISHSCGRCRGKGERISDREKELPSKSCACPACILVVAERHAIRIVPQVHTSVHWINHALVQTSPGVHTHTRIHTQTMPDHAMPCHPDNPSNPIHNRKPIPSRPFLARPDRPHSCSRLAAAATCADRQQAQMGSRLLVLYDFVQKSY